MKKFLSAVLGITLCSGIFATSVLYTEMFFQSVGYFGLVLIAIEWIMGRHHKLMEHRMQCLRERFAVKTGDEVFQEALAATVDLRRKKQEAEAKKRAEKEAHKAAGGRKAFKKKLKKNELKLVEKD